ncbi:MAG: hypothetical protein HJJLKODD_02286 [Phycisphaerae bacterium]|nr:hypothetical protein [Phycisphaerae bacterium]
MVPDIQQQLADYSATLNNQLAPLLSASKINVPEPLHTAVLYSLQAPGKRLRPYLVERSYALAGGRHYSPHSIAWAVECAHVFTLIHDDLPCMDDAQLRRGQPANHRVFGEAMAVLAGDALLALAFELLARQEWSRNREMTAELAGAIGWSGVIGGQVADLQGERQAPALDLVNYIHQQKTARLIVCALRLGALAADAPVQVFNKLEEYGWALGMAFQITDDLLDETGAPGALGKDTRRDAARAKQTYPAVMGREASIHQGQELIQQATLALADFGPEAEDLRSLAQYIMNRTN